MFYGYENLVELLQKVKASGMLERGECIGGEIEEAKFTVWICKE